MKHLRKYLLASALALAIPCIAEEPEEAPYPLNGHSLFASVGFSHIVSDVYTTWTTGEPRLGLDWQAGYAWLSKRNIGAGFLYQGYYAHGGEGTWAGKLEDSMYVNYFAPQFTGAVPLGKGIWSLTYAAGIGFAMLTQSAYSSESNGKPTGSGFGMRLTEYGWGTNASLGVECRCSKEVAIVASFSWLNSFISQDLDKYYIPSGIDRDKTTGISRLSIDIGIKLHL